MRTGVWWNSLLYDMPSGKVRGREREREREKQDRQRTCNSEARWCNRCCSVKAITVTYSECVFVGLGIQREMRLWYIVICDLPGYTIFFYVFSQKAPFSGKKKLVNVKCVFLFSLQHLFETFLILGRTERGMIKNAYWPSCKVPLLLSDFNETWVFSTDFRKITKYQILWKFVQWESSSMRIDEHQCWR